MKAKSHRNGRVTIECSMHDFSILGAALRFAVDGAKKNQLFAGDTELMKDLSQLYQDFLKEGANI